MAIAGTVAGEVEICVAGIILSLLIGFTAFCLCSTLIEWPFESCQYNYFNNPWIDHKCERCIKECVAIKEILKHKKEIKRNKKKKVNRERSMFDETEKEWTCPGGLSKKGYYEYKDGYKGAVKAWKNMHRHDESVHGHSK